MNTASRMESTCPHGAQGDCVCVGGGRRAADAQGRSLCTWHTEETGETQQQVSSLFTQASWHVVSLVPMAVGSPRALCDQMLWMVLVPCVVDRCGQPYCLPPHNTTTAAAAAWPRPHRLHPGQRGNSHAAHIPHVQAHGRGRGQGQGEAGRAVSRSSKTIYPLTH